MFIESDVVEGTVEMDEEALVMFNNYIVRSDDDPDRKAFILNAIFAGAVFDPEIAKMVITACASAVAIGVPATVAMLNNEYDAATGPDRVEAALASGKL